MLVQNLYQRRRMYTRIALGKNNAMDVVSGESSGSSGQLLLLYPLLLGKWRRSREAVAGMAGFLEGYIDNHMMRIWSLACWRP